MDKRIQPIIRTFEAVGERLYEEMPSSLEEQYKQILAQVMTKFDEATFKYDGSGYRVIVKKKNRIRINIFEKELPKLFWELSKAIYRVKGKWS